MKILMIEDDVELAEILSEFLGRHGIEVVNCDEPYTGISAATTQQYDLLLLDLTLPNLDGLEVCKRISKQKDIPIIISSARNDLNDKVEALECGADDYIPKPYDPKELLARIQSLLRRYNKKPLQGGEVQAKNTLFRIDHDAREVYMQNRKLELTRAEYEILTLLISKKGYVFSRESIAIESESINPESSNKSIDVIIGRLRSKIEKDPKKPKHIISVRGVGYKLEF
ncbi:Transcriptional regulatory protein ompR [Helicobacter ailurogastricus]|uniref:Transcriptional regulatory protein ompR n=3 Tax=Helicobacter ailurogastricus TaxID=1578720 RepID=A0A0K2XBK3_9HELI|nr:Response regulator ArsR [Helicobacter ailurogastricus]CRF41747.1 Transcriptional regulatory protein ompR [Helicobacter ailurogastricus]CRF42089.1 Transcriptional regulatory protein ompR [Helicobacter ailurogastricus]CRF44158.1 Transcriptional regulatory protein ompR [Helicobacter ailurogastricus]